MSGLAIKWVDAAGYVASILVFATFCMRTMIALRVAAIGSNICFIGFGVAAHVYPVLLLHLVLLPLNTIRTFEMMRLTRRIEVAAKGDLSFKKREASIPPIKAAPNIVNNNDRHWFNSKVTAQPTGTYLQRIKLSGARERVARKTYIRAPRFPNPALDKMLAQCKADKTWNTIENPTSGHCVMLDEPEWLADQLLKAT